VRGDSHVRNGCFTSIDEEGGENSAASSCSGGEGVRREGVLYCLHRGDITQQAKVAQGTFYNYFPSKHAIFEELVRNMSHSFRNEIREAIKSARSFEESQRIGFRTFFSYVKSHRNLYSIVQQAVLVDKELYRWYYDRLASGYIKGLQEAIGDEEIKKYDTETIAYCLMGISQFLGMRWVYWENQTVPEHVLENAIAFIFNGLKK